MLRRAVLLGSMCALVWSLSPRALAQPSDERRDDASSEASSSPFDSHASLGLVLGGKVGAGLGAPFNDFGATPVLELEIGYAPQLGATLGRSLEVFLIGQYAQPGMDGSGAEPDARLPGDGGFSYEISQQMFSLSLGALYRFDIGSQLLMPYGGLGGRMYMLRTQAKGDASAQPVGETDETQAALGLVLLGGVDVFVGPGALLAELSFGWTRADGYVLRDTNLSALSLSVGYRVIL